MGYEFTRRLMAQCGDFSAIFAYNDIAAIGAIHALREGGLRVPEDVSVLGFDDIREAAFQSPPLTTVVQPMQIMGEIAAQTLIDRIDNGLKAIPEIKIQPELVVRQSTAQYSPRP
jgi:LacI family transcriptional regulator